jgi:hypothetical protein
MKSITTTTTAAETTPEVTRTPLARAARKLVTKKAPAKVAKAPAVKAKKDAQAHRVEKLRQWRNTYAQRKQALALIGREVELIRAHGGGKAYDALVKSAKAAQVKADKAEAASQ